MKRAPRSVSVRFLRANSGALSSIEVSAPRERNLLSGIYQVLLELGVQVSTARARLDHGRLAEAFIVSEASGAPLTEARHREIQERIIPLLSAQGLAGGSSGSSSGSAMPSDSSSGSSTGP